MRKKASRTVRQADGQTDKPKTMSPFTGDNKRVLCYYISEPYLGRPICNFLVSWQPVLNHGAFMATT